MKNFYSSEQKMPTKRNFLDPKQLSSFHSALNCSSGVEQPSEIPADEYYEFIQKCKKIEQENNFPHYSEKVQEMFGVTEIEQIFFEYQDGSGDHFTELFEYRATVGIGGFGFVIAALDKETGEEIAIKMLNLDYSSGV
ncbi:unnamed protein product [Moneuplotes crassus]|uniref:Protein kinase domain-containing protein n=1 Tax=Euplotes crassus TaxID=5936 RepID=A0AAD1U986_EUPCR|nr:unnamed protein product [Moneuplotes crassus]